MADLRANSSVSKHIRHLVGRRGLVVTESVVTRRLGHVEGITMNLETVRFPGEHLLHREELEGRGGCVQGLRQCSLLHFFVIFKPLRYTCRRNHCVLKRRLVKPWDSVSHLRITQVQQRRPGSSFVLAGLTLNNPFDVVTACLKIWYWAAEIFLLSPSSSSSSKMDLLASGSKAGVKLTGDPSRVEDSTDEDLETGERDLDSLDSLQLLARLTGVLTCLTGVLVDLCGVLGLLSGVLAGVADLLSVESCLGAGNDDWTAGVSGTLAWSIWRCNNVHIDIQSTSVAWLMDLGIEGKSGLLVPVNMETSGPPPAVVAAEVPCPADSSTGWRAGPSDPTRSSNCRAQLWDDSTTETSAGSSTVAGPSPVAGPLPVAGPSPVVEPSPVAGPSPAAPSITGAGTWTSGADSRWTCRAGEEITVIVPFSGGLTILGDNCTSRLATYECPVLSALSCLLSWWLGGDLRSGNARDEAGDRDLWSPDDWWWRWWEEEAEGRVSDALETLLDSARLLELDPPEELGRDRSSSRRPLSRLEELCMGESCRLWAPCLLFLSALLDLRAVLPVGAGPFHRRNHGLRFTGPRTRGFGLGPFRPGWPVAAGPFGREL